MFAKVKYKKKLRLLLQLRPKYQIIVSQTEIRIMYEVKSIYAPYIFYPKKNKHTINKKKIRGQKRRTDLVMLPLH